MYCVLCVCVCQKQQQQKKINQRKNITNKNKHDFLGHLPCEQPVPLHCECLPTPPIFKKKQNITVFTVLYSNHKAKEGRITIKIQIKKK